MRLALETYSNAEVFHIDQDDRPPTSIGGDWGLIFRAGVSVKSYYTRHLECEADDINQLPSMLVSEVYVAKKSQAKRTKIECSINRRKAMYSHVSPL